MAAVYCLLGNAAFSAARLERIQQRISDVVSTARLTACHELYFVKAKKTLASTELQRLESLLGSRGLWLGPQSGEVVIVPRLGTISPWSSKATDILHGCALRFVTRIEHGRSYRVVGFDTAFVDLLYDRMTESLLEVGPEILFANHPPAKLVSIPLMADGRDALERANVELGLALSSDELAYLATQYGLLRRDPTDAELMMFAQANSEHCRHKIFNASWTVDGAQQSHSLFAWIRNTHNKSPGGVLSAYADNAAVIQGSQVRRFYADPASHRYVDLAEDGPLMIKVETHNHPTAIAPFAGAATGAGGEIRDEAATGRGAKPKAGLSGFSVSHLHLPGYPRPWETAHGKPRRIASALEIMIDGPIGAAAFNNEFGRPVLGGYFRTFEQQVPGSDLLRGYHKPIMIAGGMGNIRPDAVRKRAVSPGDTIVVLGGPAMLIGLGGGAASSMVSGRSSEDLDFASVQRDNPEMQRRCQEVIDRCWAQGDDNPIVSIHDVGAGGLANAIPEILHQSEVGGAFELRSIISADPGMSPMQIWCNEAQERYVLAIGSPDLDGFLALCERERCPVAVVGEATEVSELRLHDNEFDNRPVDVPMDFLFGKPPGMHRDVRRHGASYPPFSPTGIHLDEAISRVLRLPAVASKAFLITIGDRTVGGLVSRDQMVGPRQVPVADAAVTSADFFGYSGEAMAMGERAPLALLDAPASGRMAVAEALTNLAGVRIENIGDIKLSANWMAAAGAEGEDAALYDTVRAVGERFCPELGIAIPVGKDSLSMQTVWSMPDGGQATMLAPLSLIVSAFAPVSDVRQTLTPQLRAVPSTLILVDLGAGRDRLGGSALAQVYEQLGDIPPDCDQAAHLRAFLEVIQRLNREQRLLAYHDRSDGGVLVTVLEMAFAGDLGLDVDLPVDRDLLAFLFTEELGAVLQVADDELRAVQGMLSETGLVCLHLGRVRSDRAIRLNRAGQCLFQGDCRALQQEWGETSFAIQSIRDNPDSAAEAFASIVADEACLAPHLSFDPGDNVAGPVMASSATRPAVAILREQGVNGHVEMAAAFVRAGFDAVDVHMTDLISQRHSLSHFTGLVACGGFAYGDVLGAGLGWAKAILFRDELRRQFADFFADTSHFALGVCNGCQMLSGLAEIIPGSAHWPRFKRNRSEQYEGRLSLVEVLPSPSIFLTGMAGSRLPIAVAHGEGRASFPKHADPMELAALRFIDGLGEPTQRYPANPNGSPGGGTGWCNSDGRITIMMPHPERVFRSVQFSWAPDDWPEDSPWLRMFRNARCWVGAGG